MKKVPIKILFMVILSSLVCIVGEVVLSAQISALSSMHENIMDVYVSERDEMAEIKSLLYQHQAVLVSHALAEDAEMITDCERRETVLRQDLTELMIDVAGRCKGTDNEKSFHIVYANFVDYISNADTLLNFSRNGDRQMVDYYNNVILSSFLSRINSQLEEMDRRIVSDIRDKEETLERGIRLGEIVRSGGICLIVGMMVLSAYVCSTLAWNMDNYRVVLEKELLEKNKAIRQRNAELMKLQNGIIFGMANLIENRDSDTGEHVKRTSDYVRMLANGAKEWGIYKDELTEDYIERLIKAAPLHDVGKIMIPDYILTKPGKLTEEEFEIMKTHATEGGRIVREIFSDIEDKEYVAMAVDVATYHHERWDGRGYVRHLCGESIPLCARIMAIADVFDALISKRCYKPAFTLEEAFGIIEDSAGNHFDPLLAKVFLEIRPQIEAYVNENKLR